MKLQNIFKESYLRTLKGNVASGASLDLYSRDKFEIDNTQLREITIYEPEDLSSKMNPSKERDFESAVAIYEAYKGLPPVVATMERFWAYVTHTILFEYTRDRWEPNSGDAEKKKSNIMDHWFVGENGILRNAAATLWWGIHLTIDEDRSDKYELSRILFKNNSFRVRTVGVSRLIRHREAMIGILGFIAENPEIQNEGFENRGNFISAYFNRLGGVKQLSALDREFFHDTCNRIKEKILSIRTRDDLKKAC